VVVVVEHLTAVVVELAVSAQMYRVKLLVEIQQLKLQ
jgi:hypothetical protein